MTDKGDTQKQFEEAFQAECDLGDKPPPGGGDVGNGEADGKLTKNRETLNGL